MRWSLYKLLRLFLRLLKIFDSEFTRGIFMFKDELNLRFSAKQLIFYIPLLHSNQSSQVYEQRPGLLTIAFSCYIIVDGHKTK